MPSRSARARAALAVAFALVGAACAGRTAPATQPAAGSSTRPFDIAYHVSVADPATHYYEVEIDLGKVAGDSVLLQMPVWSPGRYARMDFARNVIHFRATDSSGAPVAWDKINGSLWRLYPKGARRVRVSYRVFANTLSGSFSVSDTAHANWNGPSLLMYVVGHKPDPVSLTIAPPKGWQVINGENTSLDQRTFRFPNYDRLADTPTEVAPRFDVDSFRVDGRLYRVMTHVNGSQNGQRQRFVRDVEKIVRYQNTVLGPPPLDMYTFLVHIGYAGSDGMEHLYSTQVINPRSWSDTAAVLPGITTVSHEYFHVWNVKRIRPAVLGPFDYSTEQYQPSLWVAEGWTQYYGEISLLRAGVVDRNAYYGTLGRLIRANLETPGRKEVSARMASFHAPFWDGGAAPMATDSRNAFFTYYFKGDGLALLLDLEIRSRTNGARSLDDALRALKRRSWDAPNASYYLQGRGYTEADVEQAVSEAAGANMHDWFERYVGGVEDPPFRETLALAGLELTTQGGEYIVKEMPGATEQQLRVREGWLSGRK